MAKGMISVKVEGVEDVKRQMRALGKMANASLTIALFGEAKAVLAESQVLVPRKTGALAGTGRVSKPTVSTGRVKVGISYGGAKAPYAMRQHEDLTLRHTSPQQAKYLHVPFLARVATLGPRLAQALEKDLQRARTNAVVSVGDFKKY